MAQGDDAAHEDVDRLISVAIVDDESLTSAAKYANPARVSVSVRTTDDSIEIEVENPVMIEPTSALFSGGRGLIGMDERVSILGGTFGAGPTGSGEFRVTAQLPITSTHHA